MPKDGRSLISDIRATLTLNPVLGLLLLAVVFILAAIYVFGKGGSHESPNLSDVFRTLGVGALAAAVTGIVDHHLLFKNFESRIRESHLEAMGIALALRTLGVQNALNPLNFCRLFADADPGETVSWLDTYCPRQDDFLAEIRAAIARNVTIRMLVIDPGCKNAQHRNIELAGEPDSGEAFHISLANFITKMEGTAKKCSGKFEIRYYDDLPCIPMYLIGEPGHPRKAYFSLFLSRATAHCTHMEIGDGEWLENMGSYFEQKWERCAGKTIGTKHKEKKP